MPHVLAETEYKDGFNDYQIERLLEYTTADRLFIVSVRVRGDSPNGVMHYVAVDAYHAPEATQAAIDAVSAHYGGDWTFVQENTWSPHFHDRAKWRAKPTGMRGLRGADEGSWNADMTTFTARDRHGIETQAFVMSHSRDLDAECRVEGLTPDGDTVRIADWNTTLREGRKLAEQWVYAQQARDREAADRIGWGGLGAKSGKRVGPNVPNVLFHIEGPRYDRFRGQVWRVTRDDADADSIEVMRDGFRSFTEARDYAETLAAQEERSDAPGSGVLAALRGLWDRR